MQKNWRELIKPKRLEIETTEPNTYGNLNVSPWEGVRHYAGECVERVLLRPFRAQP